MCQIWTNRISTLGKISWICSITLQFICSKWFNPSSRDHNQLIAIHPQAVGEENWDICQLTVIYLDICQLTVIYWDICQLTVINRDKCQLVLSPEILCFFCTCWWLSWLLSKKDLEGSWGQVWTLALSPFSFSYPRILTVKLARLGRVDTWLLSQCLSATNCGKASHRGGRAWQGLIFIPFIPGAVTPRFNSPTFAPSTSRSIHKFPRTRESMLLPLGGRGQQIEGHHLFTGQWVRLISVS